MITPGPWRLSLLSRTTVQTNGGRTVATTGGYQDNTSDGAYHYENEANALAISLVPEMIEALKAGRDAIIHYSRDSEEMIAAKIEAILSKLEGNTPIHPVKTRGTE